MFAIKSILKLNPRKNFVGNQKTWNRLSMFKISAKGSSCSISNQKDQKYQRKAQ